MDFNWFSLCAASYSETLDDGILGLPIPVGWFASQHIGVIFVMYWNEYERGLPVHQSEALLDGVDNSCMGHHPGNSCAVFHGGGVT